MRPGTTVLILEAEGYPAISAIKLLKASRSSFIVSADASPYASGLYLSDVGIVIPSIYHQEFSSAVERIIKDYSIDLILPSFEHGFDKLKDVSGNFVMDFGSAIMCKDKLLFTQIAKKNGLPVPDTELIVERISVSEFPKYVKPRFGTGSRDNYVVRDKEQFGHVNNMIKGKGEFIIQDLLVGEHWNIDVLVEDGRFLRAIPRRDIKRRDGIAVVVEVRDYFELIDFSKKVQELLSIGSTFNLEVFETEPGIFVINEINVRFGGGVVFGALSGCDIVSYMVTRDKTYLGRLIPGIYSRYYEEVFAVTSNIKHYTDIS